MKYNIRGKKIDVTPSIKDYIEEKIGKLDKYISNSDDVVATVVVRINGIDQIVEVTINMPKYILRAEEKNVDLYSAIDLVGEKLEKQIKKNKDKIRKKMKERKFDDKFDFEDEVLDLPEELDQSKIVKRKIIDDKPMSEEEAILQMELLGHSFFVFINSDTNKANVLYVRKDGNYGIIAVK